MRKNEERTIGNKKTKRRKKVAIFRLADQMRRKGSVIEQGRTHVRRHRFHGSAHRDARRRIVPPFSRPCPRASPPFSPHPPAFPPTPPPPRRFCRLRARRRAVCSSSPSVCRPPSVEDHVCSRVRPWTCADFLSFARAFSTPPLSAASPSPKNYRRLRFSSSPPFRLSLQTSVARCSVARVEFSLSLFYGRSRRSLISYRV